MKDVGSDLWTPPAVSIFKSKLQKTILNSLNDNLLNTSKINGSTTTTNTSNGDSKITPAENSEGDIVKEGDETETTTPSNPTDEQGPKLVQAIFDLLYLDKILSVSRLSIRTPGFDDAIKDLRHKAEIEDASLERLRKSSGDYYKRTYLLFGLLAVG